MRDELFIKTKITQNKNKAKQNSAKQNTGQTRRRWGKIKINTKKLETTKIKLVLSRPPKKSWSCQDHQKKVGPVKTTAIWVVQR